MKPLYKTVAATMLFLLLGVSGAACLAPDGGMSDAEKACCRKMAGQCDMSGAAKHPCCREIVQRHDVANLNEPSHFTTPVLSSQVLTLGSELFQDVRVPSFALAERFRHPAHDPPNPSVKILRV